MSEAAARVQEWIKQIQQYRPVDWDRLPEIYLYMDQVLTYTIGAIGAYRGCQPIDLQHDQ